MSRLVGILLVGVIATALLANADTHVYEQDWDTGVPGVTGHSVVIVQDNLGNSDNGLASEGEQLADVRDQVGPVTADDFFAWVHRQFEALRLRQDEWSNEHHAVVLVNGVPYEIVEGKNQPLPITSAQNQFDQLSEASEGEENWDYDEGDMKKPCGRSRVMLAMKVMSVSLMLACVFILFAHIKHVRDLRKACKARKSMKKAKGAFSEKTPLLTTLAPEGMAKEPAIIHITSIDAEYAPLSGKSDF